jgi:hypothetical protein
MLSEGVPIPWETLNTGPTLNMAYLVCIQKSGKLDVRLDIGTLSLLGRTSSLPVGVLGNVLQAATGRQFVADFLHDEVGEVLHTLRGSAHAHKLQTI